MPSSRYQSKVLRFITQQSMKLRDRTLQGVRQLKLAATWGTQIVLYPFYAIFQSARLVGKQLEQTARRVFPTLTAAIDPDQTPITSTAQQPLLPPKSDRPIQNVLTILEEALQLSNLSLQNPKSKTQNGLVQGLATLLDQKQLVWVDTNNQIHTVLTWEQQAALQQRIVFEVANYWRDRRQFAALEGSANSPLSRRFLPLPKERETMLPPVRYLRRFIAWMQTSPVAIATNIFQESALVPTQQSVNAGVDRVQMMNRLDLTSPATFGLLAPAPQVKLMSTRSAPVAQPTTTVSSVHLTPLYPERSTHLATNGFTPLNPHLAPLNALFSHSPSPLLPPSIAHAADVTSVPLPLAPNAPNGKRTSWWHKLLNWIVSPTQAPTQTPTAGNRSIPPQIPTLPSLPLPNPNYPTVAASHAPKTVKGVNNGLNDLPVELTRNLWFDPDYQGSEQGWFNANQINQVRRQREFPPIVPSLPARINLNAQSSSLNASYASIEANLTEMTKAGLITTHVPNTINEADFYPGNPFPESAAAMLNTPGSTPDPVSLETYLAHHGAAYDFRHTEDSSMDRNVLYQVSTEAETIVQNESGGFSLDLTDQPNPGMTNTWLDATAEVVGYDKHPLERFLGWVDLGMAWIERRIANVWYWMRDRL